MSRSGLEKVAQKYREDGYDVRILPSSADLPDFLHDFTPDLLATKGAENVIVEVKDREELLHNSAISYVAAEVNSQPGWRFDLVVERNDLGLDTVTSGSTEPDGQYILQLADSAERLIAHDELIAACLVGWSAIEAALRFMARRAGLSLESKAPRYVLNALATEGLISQEDYAALNASFQARNTVAHGLRSISMTPSVPEFMIEMTRRLLQSEMSPATAS